MGFTLGSLAVISGFRPSDYSSFFRLSSFLELRYILLSVLVFFATLVLAYFTNPSEASFRFFLTEQAFRHHLSRLDDVDAQDESDQVGASAKPDARSRRGLSSSTFANRSITSYASPPFAFASRASVSLRTPKHMFRSFGILSVAAVVPSSTSNRSSPTRRLNGDSIATRADKESGTGPSASFSIFDSWFIGVFGMWFSTFNLDSLWRDAGFVTKDDVDGTITGVLGIKALDRSDECNRTSYTLFGNGNSNHTQRTAPKLRSRERSAHHNGNAPSHRSQTPPPLPKSVSLPLHAKRGSEVSSPERISSGRNHHSNNSFTLSSGPSIGIQPPISITPEFRSINTSAPPALSHSTSSPSISPSRSPSALFASSPLITELLRQLSSSQNAISDLRNQISDFNSTSASTRAALDDELEKQRERKRIDDSAKTELKVQTKTLEDQKRLTEATRRDAEKRLRTVLSEKNNTDARIECHEREINKLQSQKEAQSAAIVASSAETSVLVAELEQQIEEKRSEVRIAEDEVAQLSLRLREMEESVTKEEQRLSEAIAESEERRAQSLQNHAQDDNNALQGAFVGGEHFFTQPQAPSEVAALPLSPVRGTVPDSPLAASPTDAHVHRVVSVPKPLDANLANGFPILSSPFNPRNQTSTVSHTFSPFSSDLASPGPLSPTGESLIPSSLYESLGMPVSGKPLESPVSASELSVSRSFQSEDDMILDRNWLSRRNSTAGDVGQQMAFPSNGAVHNPPASPVSTVHGYDTFNAYDMGHPSRGRTTSLGLDAQRASFSSRLPTSDLPLQQAFPNTILSAHMDSVEPASVAVTTRRSGWFTSHKDKNTKTQEKKGLNPDAKEFSLSKEKERSFSAFLSRSRGSGHGHGSGSGSGSSSTPSTASIPTPEPPSLGSSPALASAVTVKNPSPQMHHMTPARNATSFFGLGSSLFPSRAFAPTPLEREQLSRALGGTANSSLEKLERWPSLPTSPQSKHVLAIAQNQSVISLPQLGVWDGAGPATGPAKPFGSLGGHEKLLTSGSGFSPFDDEPAGRIADVHSSPSSTSSPERSSGSGGSFKGRR